MKLEDREKMEDRFINLRDKLLEIQTVINIFSTSVLYVPLGKLEQQYAFSSLGALIKNVVSETDLADDEFRKIKD